MKKKILAFCSQIFSDGNKIESLESSAFLKLTRLSELDLKSNICIDAFFGAYTTNDNAETQQKINRKCGSTVALERCNEEKKSIKGRNRDVVIADLKKKIQSLEKDVELFSLVCQSFD